MKKIISIALALLMLASFAVFTISCDSANDEIIVNTNAFFAPFEYYVGDEIVGVDVEIMNMVGEKMGKKDIIKVDGNVELDMNVIGYFDPGATVTIIKDSAVVEKKKITLPERITNVILCKNPRCITTTEQELPHVFRLTDEKNRIYRCLYCEAKAERK